MKIAYVATWNLGRDDAVCRKFEKQVSEWLDLGHDARVFAITENIPLRKEMIDISTSCVRDGNTKGLWANIKKFFAALGYWSSVSTSINDWGADVVYLRQQSWSPGVNRLLKSIPTVIEINSRDLAEADILRRQSGLRGLLLHYYRCYTRNMLYRNASGLVAVTHELLNAEDFAKYDLPGIVSPNSVKFTSEDRNSTISNREQKEKPTVIMVAAHGRAQVGNHWHGIDKILKLAENSCDQLDFIIVGDASVAELNPGNNVEVLPRVSPDALHSLYQRVDVAFGTLALHRKKMDEACPFKVREALSKGLPVILGCLDTAFFEGEAPEWILQLPNNEDNVERHQELIIQFCKKWMGKRIPLNEVKPFIDSQVIESEKLMFLESVAKGRSYLLS